MAVTKSDSVNEIKSWLKSCLKGENLKDFSVDVLGSSEKGDGYIGDIVFATVNGLKSDGTREKYNLVLKCSKQSKALRETSPVKEAFLNEMEIYKTVFPYFVQFQKEKGVKNIFNSFPKCYGTYVGESMEVIVLENLKCSGYDVWPRKQPLTRKHLEMVVTEYGKYHAISVAIKRERPQEFQKLISELEDVFDLFAKTGDMITLFGVPIDLSIELLKNELDKKTLEKWQNFKNSVKYIITEMFQNSNGVKVISHGDSWNNNFMFLHEKDDEFPTKMVIIDFQIAKYTSPITDLSYFLFSCASERDLQNLNDVLRIYHKSFVNHLKELGVKEANTLYPLEEFFSDWKKYCKFGILMASLLMKIVSTDKDEVVNLDESADAGKDFTESFLHKIRDTDNFKKRIRPILEYAVKNNFI